MSILDSPEILSGNPWPRISTTAVDDTELVSGHASNTEAAAWCRFIDYTLIEWGRNPGALEDDDFVPPSRETITSACQLAKDFRDRGLAAPDRVMPDGDGGVCFERGDRSALEVLYVHDDQTIELLVFENCKLVERRRLC